MVANQIRDFQPQIDFLIFWLVSPNTQMTSPPWHHDELDQGALFLQSTISLPNPSKSQVIHLFFILLITIEDTMILKSTKSSKSQTKSTSSSCHVINPWKFLPSLYHIHFHQILCIHPIKHSFNESRQHPIMQTLNRFHCFHRKSVSTVSQRQLSTSSQYTISFEGHTY